MRVQSGALKNASFRHNGFSHLGPWQQREIWLFKKDLEKADNELLGFPK